MDYFGDVGLRLSGSVQPPTLHAIREVSGPYLVAGTSDLCFALLRV